MSMASNAPAKSEAFPIGQATMSPAMEHADRYARYLYDSVRPWLEPPILEVGTGFGTYTGLLLQHGEVITIDIDSSCLHRARQRFNSEPLTTARVDLNDIESTRGLVSYGARSIFCSNVLEHISDDVAVLAGLHDAIAPGGTICLIVPAHPGLYGFMDRQAGHHRRYTRRSLEWTLVDAGWSVETTFYINSLGAAGWWLNQRFLSPRPLTARTINTQLAIYDRLVVPVARVVDPFFARLFGLSVVAIARRKNSWEHPCPSDENRPQDITDICAA